MRPFHMDFLDILFYGFLNIYNFLYVKFVTMKKALNDSLPSVDLNIVLSTKSYFINMDILLSLSLFYYFNVCVCMNRVIIFTFLRISSRPFATMKTNTVASI